MPGEKVAMVHDSIDIVATGLTSGNAVTTATKIDAARFQGLHIQKVKFMVGVSYVTDGDEGPFEYGLAVGLTADQIEEALAADPQYQDVPETAHRSQRAVYPIGLTYADGTSAVETQTHDGTNLMRTLTDFPKWKVREGNFLVAYGYNYGVAAVTAAVQLRLLIIGRWLDD